MAIKSSKKKLSLNRLKGPTKGKIEKKKKFKNGKTNSRSKLPENEDDSFDYKDLEVTVKKKPSKSELKAVIEALKKDPDLIMVRKALKYIPHYLKSEGFTKKLLKEVIRLWAEASEKVRVVCLLCLVRLYTKIKDKERKQMIVKKLYNSFLDKCRITKQETMSMISFMRHSLIELYKIDPQIAFKQAQSACQQLSITLKNATNHKNEETYKTVLNWQFVNCLILLSGIVTSQDDKSPVKALTNQIIQLNLGSFHLLSSPRYYPFYCHIIENLINLSASTNLFIPILPMLLGILKRISLQEERVNSKKSKAKKDIKKASNEDDDDNGIDEDGYSEDYDDETRVNTKEYNMELLNHVSLEESHNLKYNLAVLDKIFELLLRYVANQCHSIAFPELMLLPSIQLKKWMKKNSCESTKKFKILSDKIKHDCELVEEARRSITFAFNNYSAVDAWEKKLRDSGKLSLPKMIDK